MKDKLERFINENRKEFDRFEPNPNVWENIKVKVSKPVQRKLFPWNKVLWRAASVIVIFVISFTISEFIHTNKRIAETEKEDIIRNEFPEIIEAEAYYTSLVNSKLTQIKKYATIYPNLQKQVDYDLVELDSVYMELKNDLKDNVHNKEIVEAMIQNYRLKLQVLEEILSSLDNIESKSQKVDSYEI
jgi:hypothetical protein